MSAPLEYNFVWDAYINSEKLNGIVDYDISEVPLYVQSHVFIRMQERCKPIHHCLIDAALASAAMRGEVLRTHNGTLMLKVYFGTQQLGYLVLEPLKDKLVGKTFLFITQNGTPEGDRLTEILKLYPKEKSWLGIDKLEPFLISDILDDPRLKDIFHQCGLDHMLDVKDILHLNTSESCAQRMRKYLMLDEYSEVGDGN